MMNERSESTTVEKPTLLGRANRFFSGWFAPVPPPQPPADANTLAQMRTDYAILRTLMATERTLMAWVRTALSMISFGFTIYKVLQGLQSSGEVLVAQYEPRTVGLFLIGAGTLSMVLGAIEYWQTLKQLRQVQEIRLWRGSFFIAVVITVIGLSTFVSVIAELI